MHDGRWDDGWSGGSGLWMALMMVAFVAVIVWVIISFSRRTSRMDPAQEGSVVAGPPTPQAILAERFARGEIESEEYSTRLAVLRSASSVPPR